VCLRIAWARFFLKGSDPFYADPFCAARGLALFLNLLIPGTGLMLLGYWRWALLTQGLLITNLVLVCWSRWVFEPAGILFSAWVIGFLYLVSSLACLFVQARSTKLWLPTLGFLLICCTGFATGFIYKQHWLGVGIYFVPSMSMHPALKPGQFIILDTWAYHNETPLLNDVVVFEHGIENQHLVKRITLWPNGELTKKELWYVMGDNRKASQDSRYFGGVATEQLIGKVKLVLVAFDKNKPLNIDIVLSPVH